MKNQNDVLLHLPLRIGIYSFNKMQMELDNAEPETRES